MTDSDERVMEEDYLPPLPPRPPKRNNNENVWQNFSNLWTKVPQQLQGPVKVILIVLGCVLALVIAGLIGRIKYPKLLLDHKCVLVIDCNITSLESPL